MMWAVQVFAQSDIEVVNIENPAVQAYMADRTYSTEPDFKVVVVKQYYDTTRYGNYLDRPQGKKVEWTTVTAPEDIARVCISVSEYKDFSHAATHYTDSAHYTSYVIKNMIPNRMYYYKVEEILVDGKLNTVARGMFRTVGQVRMIEVERARNVRDLGGWTSMYGGTVRYGRLFRSANLDRIKDKGRHELVHNLNVVAELDLRGESRLKSSPLGEDQDFLRNPLPIKGSLATNGRVYAKNLRWIIARLREGKSVDWHCAIGCDRCGKMSLMIEGLLGLSEEDLGRDFELSTFSNRYRPRYHIKSVIDEVKKLAEPGDCLANCFYKMWLSFGVPSEDLEYLLDTMIEVPKEQSKK